MGLPQWARTNKGRGGEGNAPLACLHLTASSAHPQLPPCPLTSSIPAPWHPRASQMGHPRALLPTCKVWSRVPSPGLTPNSPAIPGLWRQRRVSFPSSAAPACPWGCLAPTARTTSVKLPSKMTAGWPLATSPRGSLKALRNVNLAPGGSGHPLHFSVPQFPHQ